MFTKALFILLFMLTVHSSFSQFNYGVRRGIQLTNLYSNRAIDAQWRPAYHIGIFGSYSFNKKISAQAELLYSDKGHQSDYGNSKIIYHTRYLNVPLILQYNLTSRFSVVGGGEFGLLLSSYSKYDDKKVNQRKYFGNPIDLGLLAGIAFQFEPRSTVTLRYIYGLSNIISKDATVNVADNVFNAGLNARDLGYTYHNQTIQLSLSYAFRNSKYVTTTIFPDSSHYVVPKFSLGVKAGLNINDTFYRNLPGYKSDESRTSVGFHVGMFFQIRLANKISFIPEFQFIKKGYKSNQQYYYDQPQLDLYYLEFPFLFSYSPTKFVSIEGGLVPGLFLLTSKNSIPNATAPYSSGYNYEKRFEFGINVGLHFNISERFSVACRYYRGMTTISSLNYYNNTKEYNHNAQISVYYKLKQIIAE